MAQAMLRQLHLLAESQRGDVAVAPVLRMALDAVNSETSLHTEARMRDMDLYKDGTWKIGDLLVLAVLGRVVW